MKLTAVIAAVALATQAATPAFAGPYNEYTMLGARTMTGPAVMGYVRLPFNETGSAPRAGLMVTSPGVSSAGHTLVRSATPGMVDFGFTGRDFNSPWTATLNVSNRVAWASNPDALPKNSKQFLESGTSWIVVGVLSAAIIVGVYSASNKN